MKTLHLLIFLSLSKLAYSCSCQVGTIKQSYEDAAVIFYGRHIQNLFSKDIFTLTGERLQVDNFQVIKFFKKGLPDYYFQGNSSGSNTISLKSYCNGRMGGSQSDCSFCFESAKYYLVYCNRNIITGELEPIHCSRTHEVLGNDFIIKSTIDKEVGKDEAKELTKFANTDSSNQNLLSFGEIWKNKFNKQEDQIAELSTLMERYKLWTLISTTVAIILIIILLFKILRK